MNASGQPEGDPHALKVYYLDLFRRNRAAILAAGALGFDSPIKGCPGWDVAAAVGHIGRVYTFWLQWVRERPRGFSRAALKEIAADRDTRLPGYSAWDRAGFPKASRPSGIIDFARHAGDDLDTFLVDLEPEETVWTFVPPRQTGAFVFRRLAMETTIHRWDVEEAHGIASPIESLVARDGIDEMLMMFRDDPAYESNQEHRHGQTILLREDSGADDSSGPAYRRLVSFDHAGICTSPGEGPADTTITGSASDLWLYIMGRRSAKEMRIEGDAALAASWGDLAGRF